MEEEEKDMKKETTYHKESKEDIRNDSLRTEKDKVALQNNDVQKPTVQNYPIRCENCKNQ